MLQQKVFCQGTIDSVFFEAHPWGDVTNWKDNRTYAALRNHISGADCGIGGAATSVTDLDDETFVLDDVSIQQYWEAKRETERNQVILRIGIVAAVSLLVGFVWIYFERITTICRSLSLKATSVVA